MNSQIRRLTFSVHQEYTTLCNGRVCLPLWISEFLKSGYKKIFQSTAYNQKSVSSFRIGAYF